MSEMKPCPFCGGEARFETYGGTACAVVCQTCQCGTSTVCLDDGMRAVEAWNRRAERTCRMELLWIDGEDGECYECSECGDIAFTHCDAPEYCPNCGAKVVDE